MTSEISRVGAIIRRRGRDRGVRGFGVAIGLCLLICLATIIRRSEFGTAGSHWLNACCAERDGYPLHRWIVRLPGSLIAPAPELPVWGSLAQVLVVVGIAEAAMGRIATVTVGLLGHFISAIAARVLLGAGSDVPGALPHIDRYLLDTGPSAATVALTAYLVVVLRCPMLGAVAGAGIAAAAFEHSGLAASEHLVAWAVGMLCGVIQLLLLRGATSRGATRTATSGRMRSRWPTGSPHPPNSANTAACSFPRPQLRGPVAEKSARCTGDVTVQCGRSELTAALES
jgi:hypothetical protein